MSQFERVRANGPYSYSNTSNVLPRHRLHDLWPRVPDRRLRDCDKAPCVCQDDRHLTSTTPIEITIDQQVENTGTQTVLPRQGIYPPPSPQTST